MRHQSVGGFVLSGVVIDAGGFFRRAAFSSTSAAGKDVNNIIMRMSELALREEREQVFISAMPVHDDNFFTAIAGHFIGGLLQYAELQFDAVGHGARLVLGFENLSEVGFG